MKKLIILIFISTIGFTQTYTTINIDGTNDFTTSTDRFNSTSGTGIYGYITWDATYLYIGYSGSTNSGTMTDNTRVYHVYIDTDPLATATNGNGTTDGEAWRTDPTLPFTANYHYAFKTVDNSETKRVYSSGSWSNATIATSNFEGSGFWECSIKRSDIGTPSQIYFLMYVEEDWGGGYVQGGIPNDIFTDNTSQGSQTFASGQWLGFTLTSDVTPNASGNYDQSLPVELTSFTAASNRDGNVLLEWETASEIDNLGFLLDRKTSSENWTEIASYITHPALQGQGSVSYATRYAFLDESVISGTNYDYRLADVDIFGNVEYHPLQALNVNPNENLPSNFELVSIYPNPFNPSTIIEFSQGKSGHVNIDVIDITGRTVKSLGDQDYAAGRFSIKWDGSMDNGQSVSNGIYFIQIQAGDQLISRKIVYLK